MTLRAYHEIVADVMISFSQGVEHPHPVGMVKQFDLQIQLCDGYSCFSQIVTNINFYIKVYIG